MVQNLLTKVSERGTTIEKKKEKKKSKRRKRKEKEGKNGAAVWPVGPPRFYPLSLFSPSLSFSFFLSSSQWLFPFRKPWWRDFDRGFAPVARGFAPCFLEVSMMPEKDAF